MSPGVATKVIAACIGLCAFAIAIIVGVVVDNPAHTIIGRALLCMFACQIIGFIIGAVMERTAAEAIAQYQHSKSAGGRAPSSSRAKPASDEPVLVV